LVMHFNPHYAFNLWNSNLSDSQAKTTLLQCWTLLFLLKFLPAKASNASRALQVLLLLLLLTLPPPLLAATSYRSPLPNRSASPTAARRQLRRSQQEEKMTGFQLFPPKMGALAGSVESGSTLIGITIARLPLSFAEGGEGGGCCDTCQGPKIELNSRSSIVHQTWLGWMSHTQHFVSRSAPVFQQQQQQQPWWSKAAAAATVLNGSVCKQ
jgi:hypothetical protein